MELFLGILLGLFVLVILVVLHELGHAIVAKRNGVEVEEFGIGFPPRAWTKKLKNGVLFSLNWLPFGGFVKLKGEHDAARGKGTYGAASFWVKTKILLAGVLINWITAALLLTVISLWGLPKILPNQVVLPFDNTVVSTPVEIRQVEPGSPAETAGLKPGDAIEKINDNDISSVNQVRSTTESLAGKTVTIQYKRGNDQHTTKANLRSGEAARKSGYLGVGSQQSSAIKATWSAPILGFATAGQLTYESITGLGSIIGKSIGGFFGQFASSDETRQQAKSDLADVGNSVTGPIGILGNIFPSIIDSGVIQILFLAAIISLSLAVMNVLPIPALDGGRWFTMAGFKLFKKKLTREREESIQVIGFFILLALMVLVTWSDVGKFF